VLVAPGASGTFDLTEDAEDDLDAGRGPRPDLLSADEAGRPAAETSLSWDRDRQELRVGALRGRAEVVPVRREWTVTFLALLPDGDVTVDGDPVQVTGHDGRWSVRFPAASEAGAVVRVGGAPLRVGVDPVAAVRAVLERAQMGNPEKLAAWEVVTSGRGTVERLAELHTVALPEDVRAAVVELLATVADARA
jgi:hypothetical protein